MRCVMRNCRDGWLLWQLGLVVIAIREKLRAGGKESMGHTKSAVSGGAEDRGVCGKRGLGRAFDVFVAGFIVVSIVWTCLSAFFFVRGFLRVRVGERFPVEVGAGRGVCLPRFDGGLRLGELFAAVVGGGSGDSSVGVARNSPRGALVGASICVLVPDSLFFYRFAYLGDCGCPLAERDRYDLWLRYVDPQSGRVFREEIRKGLTAEEVSRLVEFVEIERR